MMTRTRCNRSLAARCVRLAAMTGVVWASTAIAQQTPSAGGLNALSDDALLNEIAQRDLPTLLEHLFETKQTPAQQRDAIRASAALAKLTREGAALPIGPRRAAVKQIVAGIGPVVPTMSDPRMIMRQADALMSAGAAAEVNTLEYWGASSVAQAQLRPIAQVTIALLNRAIELADAQAEALAVQSDPGDANALRRIEAAEFLAQLARQSRAMAEYQLALSSEPSDPERTKAVDDAIQFLEPLDSDQNPARDAVRVALGKLFALKGDFAKARAVLDAAVESTALAPGSPPQGVPREAFLAQQRARAFESRFFRTLVDVQARDVKAARQQFELLTAWQQSNAPDDPAIATALRLLEYRIVSLESGEAARQRASALLMELLAARPDLEGPIMTQLRANVPADAPVASLEPLLLRSLVTDAQDRIVRAQADPNSKPEPAILRRGMDAARELIRRRGEQGVNDRTAAEAAFLVPVFLEALDQKAEAARVYLDFAAEHREMPELARAALENAQRVFAQLGGLRSDDPGVTQLYDRILPLAIEAPFDQRDLLYDWGLRLQQTDRPAEAAAIYERIRPDEPRYDAARYLMLVALARQLEETEPNDPAYAALARRVGTVADEVQAASRQALQARGDSMPMRQRLARATLVSAEVARTAMDDPARAVKLLDGIETTLTGLPDEDALLGEAIFTRVQANAALNNTDRAVADLERLLSQSGGARGAQVVYNLLMKLERDFDAAETAGDRERMAKIQANRAILTSRLVQWASQNLQDPALLYRYRVYDAETQRIAANLLDDPAAAAAKRAEARQLFEALDAPDGRALFAKSRPADQPAPRFDYDPRVALGLARLKFNAGDWPAAEQAFARLLADNAVGGATAIVRDPVTGEQTQVDNDAWWESSLRLFQSRLKTGGDAEPIRQWLREQYARKGDAVGGDRWRAEFDALRQELLPNGAPASQPRG